MKITFIPIAISLLLFFCQNAKAQIHYEAIDAPKHLNQTITICDTVFKTTSFSLNRHLFYLGSSTSKKFIVVVDNSVKKKRLDNSFMIGHEVCVTGKIKRINGLYILFLTGKMLYKGPIDL